MADEPRTDKVQFNVHLPSELVVRVKHACIDEGLSLSAYVERALRRQIDETGGEP